METSTGGTERILTLHLSTQEGVVNLVCIYAPILTPEAKDQFYEQVDSVIKRISESEHLFLLGDFNARVSADHEYQPNVQALLELGCYHKLSVTNNFFQNKA